jgi:hypothetical protein
MKYPFLICNPRYQRSILIYKSKFNTLCMRQRDRTLMTLILRIHTNFFDGTLMRLILLIGTDKEKP